MGDVLELDTTEQIEGVEEEEEAVVSQVNIVVLYMPANMTFFDLNKTVARNASILRNLSIAFLCR